MGILFQNNEYKKMLFKLALIQLIFTVLIIN